MTPPVTVTNDIFLVNVFAISWLGSFSNTNVMAEGDTNNTTYGGQYGDLERLGYRVEVNMNMGEGVDMCALHYNIEVDK